ncbi:MAG: 5'/3'-nucleotidase SurE [Candidatus Cloacimonadales bacterium]
MKILLTNDDGIHAPGILALERELHKRGHDLLTVAPLTQQSATSHSISLFKPMKFSEHGNRRYALNGTPSDCMILGSQVIFDQSIDLVISGINSGPNMGEDVLYSGTVAAALEAMFLGFKSIAISISDYENQNFATAARVMADLLEENIVELIAAGEALNINVPNISYEQVKGVRATVTGHRKYYNFVKKSQNEAGETEYMVGGDRPVWQEKDHSDAEAIYDNFVSITPIAPNFTNHKSFAKVKNWIKQK